MLTCPRARVASPLCRHRRCPLYRSFQLRRPRRSRRTRLAPESSTYATATPSGTRSSATTWPSTLASRLWRSVSACTFSRC
ncbi:hypothetical protein B1H18_29955, partial [Streptomyces tsukubensis]